MPLSGKPDGAEGVFRQIAPMRSEMRAAILIPHMMKKATRTESKTNGIGARAKPSTHVEAKRQQPYRGADGCEIDDAAFPDFVPDVFLRVRPGLCRIAGLEAILIGRDDLAVVIDDVVDGGQADRRVGVRLVPDPPKDGFVDLRTLDRDLVVFPFGILIFAELNQLARAVAVIATKSRTRIVDSPILVTHRDRILERIRFEFQATALCFVEHPDERDVGQRVIRVTAADVGMDTGEPNLADLLIRDVTLFVRIELRRRNDLFVPQLGMKRGSLFIERKGLAGAHHALTIERVSGKFKRHDPTADATRHLVNWQAVSGHRVPHPDEADVLDLAIVALVVLDRQ